MKNSLLIEQILGTKVVVNAISVFNNYFRDMFFAFIIISCLLIILSALIINIFALVHKMNHKGFGIEAKKESELCGDKQKSNDVSGYSFRRGIKIKNDKHLYLVMIAQLCGVLMVGVVIFNIYYKDETLAYYGSNVVSGLIFGDGVEAISTSTHTLNGTLDENQIERENLINQLSDELYSLILKQYPDLNSEKEVLLKDELKEWISYNVNNMIGMEYFEEDVYAIEKQVVLIPGNPNIDSVDLFDHDFMKTFAFTMPIQLLTINSRHHVGREYWIRVVVRFNKNVLNE
ncbi:hypothetical protein [Cytobacillus sp. IB215316]|uniref:hypothetical protein n=1 Tax=Cytobacillus sp. IB215316 TaxID=3097354 RepID=UPI002A0F8A67|nr:hypothetical protein [Cytobacillus sp. IB215316]MDX8360757.1 hypothetical protein [Cytobacillus sp. IB215316]